MPGYFGTDSFIYRVSDGRGGSTQATINVTVASLAPPIDTMAVTDLASATAFLYTGDHPLQTGVISGTIEARLVAVLRGKVLSGSGSPLSGVTITVLNHPEFGQTLSRPNGMFDIAVNGGELLTLNYEKETYLPIQRQFSAPWPDYAWLGTIPETTRLQDIAPSVCQSC